MTCVSRTISSVSAYRILSEGIFWKNQSYDLSATPNHPLQLGYRIKTILTDFVVLPELIRQK